ncbi:hypothetical protein TYRP_000736, partial [Tyrophagus putrescentiae]
MINDNGYAKVLKNKHTSTIDQIGFAINPRTIFSIRITSWPFAARSLFAAIMSHQSIAAIHSHRKNDFKKNLKTLLYNGDLSDYIFNASDTELIYAFSVSPAENGNDEEGNTCEDDDLPKSRRNFWSSSTPV